MIITIDYVREEFAKRGAELISTFYKNNSTPLYFKCSKCGKQHYITWANFSKGRNKNLLCSDCLPPMNQKLTIEFIREEFAKKGAEVISTEYIDSKSPIYFKCTKCGRPHYISRNNFISGINPNLLCPECFGIPKVDFSMVKSFFDKKGVTLISTEYINEREPIYFKCSKCGDPYYINWSNLKNGKNQDLLCDKCMKGNSFNPLSSYGSGLRKRVDHYWFNIVKEFFNIPKEDYELYSSHHILTWGGNPLFRTSILNGFPLRKEIHNSSFIDPITKVKDPFHKDSSLEQISNWPLYARLDFQDYPDFRFLDLNSKIITEIILDKEQKDRNYLINKKKELSEKGILFIPIYFEECYIDKKREIIISMLKNRIYKFYPDIYKYTNTKLTRYYARKLEIKILSYKEAKSFFENNHIQGMVGGEIYLGLFSGDLLVECMSFGKPRVNKDIYQFELLRLATLKNSLVIGGTAKLFKYFISNFKPNSIISYCDIRFSSLLPENTVYAKLGFKYIGYSAPNYKYLDSSSNRLFSRQQFQKHKLEEKLSIFDASLSEEQNMINNGFFRQYDCGNHKFLWTTDIK